MVSRLFLNVLLAVVLIGFSFPVIAQDNTDAEEVTISVHDKVEDFTKDFDGASKQHFLALYGSYNMIKVVEDVQGQVSDAVDKCGDANPDMKEAIDTRFKVWDDAINAVMDEADANVDNMIIAQEYSKPREIKKVLKFIDKKRVSRRGDVEKFPVTSPEACEYLREKMDETQENLTGLLRTTLVSLPNALIRKEDDADTDTNSAD